MVRNDFISERDAEAFAGVSASTLRRFSESGYLTVNSDETEGRLYSRSQLQDIFGVTQGPTTHSGGAPIETAAATEVVQMTAPVGLSPTCSMAINDEPRESSSTVMPHVLRAESSAGVCQTQGTEPLEATLNEISSSTGDKSTIDTNEVERLKNALETQVKLLAQRESEVHDLRSQRDWLQRRIESLEEKSNRDQILLLSETQTIRKLIALQEQKRSGFRQLLSWLGLTSPQDLTPIATSGDVVNIPSTPRQAGHPENQDSNAEAA
jgi:hypothetical protein